MHCKASECDAVGFKAVIARTYMRDRLCNVLFCLGGCLELRLCARDGPKAPNGVNRFCDARTEKLSASGR